jgi:hypothetical protein
MRQASIMERKTLSFPTDSHFYRQPKKTRLQQGKQHSTHIHIYTHTHPVEKSHPATAPPRSADHPPSFPFASGSLFLSITLLCTVYILSTLWTSSALPLFSLQHSHLHVRPITNLLLVLVA